MPPPPSPLTEKGCHIPKRGGGGKKKHSRVSRSLFLLYGIGRTLWHDKNNIISSEKKIIETLVKHTPTVILRRPPPPASFFLWIDQNGSVRGGSDKNFFNAPPPLFVLREKFMLSLFPSPGDTLPHFFFFSPSVAGDLNCPEKNCPPPPPKI